VPVAHFKDICLDTIVEGGGLQTGTRFASVPLGGVTTFSRNTLIRTGSGSMYDKYNKGYGQIWLYSDSSPSIDNVVFSDITITDSYYQGIGFYQSSVKNLSLKNISIDTADYALEERVSGTVYAEAVVATNLRIGGQWYCPGPGPFVITKGPGNSGWDSVLCQ